MLVVGHCRRQLWLWLHHVTVCWRWGHQCQWSWSWSWSWSHHSVHACMLALGSSSHQWCGNGGCVAACMHACRCWDRHRHAGGGGGRIAVCVRADTGVVTVIADGGGTTTCMRVGARAIIVVMLQRACVLALGSPSVLVPAAWIIIIAICPCGYPGPSSSSVCLCGCPDCHHRLSLWQLAAQEC